MPQQTGAAAPASPPAQSDPAALQQEPRELLLLIDGAGRLQWCNPAVETRFERSLAQMADQVWQDLLPVAPAYRPALRGVAAQLAQGLAFAGLELELELGAAGPAWFQLSAHRLPQDAAGAPAHWLCVMHDIGERKRSEREAARLSELLEMAQEFGRLGVWERQIPSGAGRWDRHVFGFWGLDPAQGIPSHDEAIAHLHPEDRARMTYRHSTRQAGRYSQRYRILRADGSMRWIHSHWEVKNSAAGVPDRAIGILMDDTEVYEVARSVGETNAQLKLAIELGNIAIWRHDLQTGRVHFNDRAQAVLNVSPSAEGMPLQEMRAHVHPDDLPQVAAAAEHALHSDGPTDIEARFAGADGNWRTVLTRRVLERAADGTPRAFVGIALDVSEQADERRRATEQLQRMEAAAAAAGVGMWSYDPATDEARWSEQMFTLVGRAPTLGAPKRQEWEGQIIHPADRRRMRDARKTRDARPDSTSEQQFRVTLPGGEVRWLENWVRKEVQSGHTVIHGVTLDITARRHAEQALHSAAERAALAARGAGIGTWEMNFSGADEHWDEQMFRLRGLEPRERPPPRADRLALLHPQDRQQVLDSRADPRRDVQAAQYEFRVRWPDGSYRWLASRSVPVLDESGQPLRRIGVNWDINEAKLAEAARQESALAQRENLAKSKFLSRMSHELRTPLNAVLGFTQLLQAERAIPKAQQARLGLIRSAGEHLLLLINDVLDLSGLETGDLKLAPQAVSLAELVTETVPLVAPLAAAHGVTLRLDALDGSAQADPTRLRQVLINLLSNAIKYNRAQGSVTISAASAGGRATLRVADSGRGLAPEQLLHLFEPFNRLGVEREGIEGSGMGLVIVKALVERMGGTVQVSSRPGEGACFSVELPAAAAAPRPTGATEPAPLAGVAASRGRLLYIEDNPVNLLLVQELLTFRPGLEFVAAANGAEGVRQAQALLPELVLIDIQLPDFDGFEVLRRLRADPRTAALRCVALSANALPEDLARARAAGFADYWTKPIHFGRFLTALDAALAPQP